MSGWRYWIPVIVVAVAAAAVGVDAHAQNQQADGVITINVTGLRNNKGVVSCTLCSSPEGYPGDCKVQQTVKAAIAGDKAACVFPHKAPGTYAATIFHDEDNDGKFKRNLIGIPKEGFGFSNNYHPSVRAPTWDEGKFNFSGGQKAITINIINW
ncbi:MAG: DUF2141 domain-containing protein [Candidatus Binataceae bacterium]